MIQKKPYLKAQCTPNGTYRLVALSKEGNMVALMDECYDFHEAGRYREACRLRSRTFPIIFQAVEEALDDNGGPITLDYTHENTIAAMEFIHTAAIDNYLLDSCEIAAAQLEMLIECNDEDPLQATPTLALCYVAIGDWDNLEAIEMDLDPKTAIYALVRCCQSYIRTGQISEPDFEVLQRYHKHLCNELLLEEHPTDESYMKGIMVNPPEPKAFAREVYLRCEVALSHQPEFVEALRVRIRRSLS